MSNDKMIKVVRNCYNNKNEISKLLKYVKYAYDFYVLYKYIPLYLGRKLIL